MRKRGGGTSLLLLGLLAMFLYSQVGPVGLILLGVAIIIAN